MCGIAGIISFPEKRVTQQELKEMTDIVEHRGPDGDGHYISADGRVGLGHRRLSIIDLSDAASQPMTFDDHTIVFNGEIYNYIEIREELKALGRSCITASDTEVIIRAYQQWGEDCLHKFNGMWAFAIYDKMTQKIFLSRDRFGVKPLYYTTIKDKFYFGSEIKQFSVLEGWEPILNRAALESFLTSSLYNNGEHTFFKGVYQLRGGNNLMYNLKTNKYIICRYYNPDLSPLKIDRKSAIQQYRYLFIDAVSLRLRADVKVGTALSGGVDSSSIAGVMNELLNEQNKTELQQALSACFKGSKLNEEEYIDSVITFNKNIASKKIYVEVQDLERNLQDLVWHMDEPFPSTSMLAQFMVFKAAKESNVTVMLDGQGADEVLGGYFGFYRQLIQENMMAKNYLNGIKNLIGIIVHQPKETFDVVIKPIFQAKKNQGEKAPINIHQTFISENAFMDKCLKATFDMSLPALLHYEDRNSMAHSIESRVPFMDYRLVEFSLRLPSDIKIDFGIRKNVLREAAKNYLPKKVYKRYDKIGFATPQEQWFKDNRAFFDAKLEEAQKVLENLFTNDRIERIILQKDTAALWRLISISEWVKRYRVRI